MPYTTNKGFSVPATGSLSGTWGSDGTTPTAQSSNALNQGVTQLLDQALAGATPLSLSSSNVTLTQLQTQNGLLRMTGTLSGAIVISPDSGVLMVGLYSWENLTTGAFTVTLSNGGGSVVLPQGRRGLLWIDVANGPRITGISGSTDADPIPTGTVMVFYQSAAPTGWTISSSLNDYALKIVSSAGGVTSGSVDYSTLFGRTAVDGYTLLAADIPPHKHFIANVDSGGGGLNQIDATTYAVYFYNNSADEAYKLKGTATPATLGLTSSVGGGGSHAHAIDMRVKSASVILASKN